MRRQLCSAARLSHEVVKHATYFLISLLELMCLNPRFGKKRPGSTLNLDKPRNFSCKPLAKAYPVQLSTDCHVWLALLCMRSGSGQGLALGRVDQQMWHSAICCAMATGAL